MNNVTNRSKFHFSCVSVDYVSKEIKKLITRKATQINDIPVKVLRQAVRV